MSWQFQNNYKLSQKSKAIRQFLPVILSSFFRLKNIDSYFYPSADIDRRKIAEREKSETVAVTGHSGGNQRDQARIRWVGKRGLKMI